MTEKLHQVPFQTRRYFTLADGRDCNKAHSVVGRQSNVRQELIAIHTVKFRK